MTLPNGSDPDEKKLLYDWNLAGEKPARPAAVDLHDETLRDGLQSPSATHPQLAKKLEIIEHAAALGIRSGNIAYPGAGPNALADAAKLARDVDRAGLDFRCGLAGRTARADIEPMAEAQQRAGVRLDANCFIGSSAIRQYTEGWDLDFILRTVDEMVRLACSLDLYVMLVTEDTTRAHPEDLRAIYTTAIEAGASRICLADTVGHATPCGVRNLVRFIRGVVADTGEDVAIDWHGHRDRGLDVVNSLAAMVEGVDRVHGTALGIGERCGNTPMDTLLVNLKLLGWIDNDLTALPAYCQAVSEATGMPIPVNYPVVGKDAFETSTGVHASAILKAQRRGDTWLADRIYSSVPAADVGLGQVITVGPMSGQANVVAWLQARGLEPTGDRVERVLAAAKESDHVLREEEILRLVAA